MDNTHHFEFVNFSCIFRFYSAYLQKYEEESFQQFLVAHLQLSPVSRFAVEYRKDKGGTLTYSVPLVFL